MSQAEYPVETDAAEIKRMLHDVNVRLDYVNERLDGHANGINAIGSNMQWMVDNVKGLFQMFASPQFMSQMSNMLMGGITNYGGQPADTPGPEPTGQEAGRTGS